MKRNVKFSKGKSLITAVGVIAICVVGLLLFSSCGTINTYLQQLKGELIGNDYNITEYDHYGNPVLRVSGDKRTTQASPPRISTSRLTASSGSTLEQPLFLHRTGPI